jgi:hypothetical protein
VPGEAVELDHDPLALPEAIDLDPAPVELQPCVEARKRQSVAAQEGHEGLLQRASHPPLVFGAAGQGGADRPRPAPARVARQEVVQRKRVVEPQVFRLAQRELDLIDRGDRGEVEDRPRHGRDRDAFLARDLVGWNGA